MTPTVQSSDVELEIYSSYRISDYFTNQAEYKTKVYIYNLNTNSNGITHGYLYIWNRFAMQGINLTSKVNRLYSKVL